MKSEPGDKMATKSNKMILANDILIVDDEAPNLYLLTQLLSEAGYQIRPTERPQLAIESALAQPPALILLNVRMQEMDGFEVCKRLKQDEYTRDIPIIFITALQDVQDKVLGFEAGCVDFITKPFQEVEVLARVQTHMELRNMQLNLEEIISERTSKLVESEARFRATFEQAAVGVAHVSLEGKFLRVNEKFCEIVGYPQDEIRKLTFQDITHSDDLNADLEFVRQVLEGGIENYTMEKRYFHKDGTIVWVDLTVSLVFNRRGNPTYFVSVIKDITKDKAVQFSLEKSEERYRTLFEESQNGIIIAEVETHTFKYANPAAARMLGYTQAELCSMRVEDIHPREELENVLIDFKAQFRGEKRVAHNVPCLRKDGTIIYTDITGSKINTLEGSFTIVFFVDVTDRRQAEETLRQSHDFLEHLTSAVPDAIISIKMPERTINWANDSFNVLGYEPEEFIGHSTKRYYAHLEDYYAVRDLQQDAIRKGDDVIRTEVIALRKDGRVIPVELTATYYKEDGKVSNITAMVRDISERKQVEDALRASEAKYRGLVDNSMIGVFTTTIDGQFLFANDAMARIYDFDSPELMIAKGGLDRWVDLEQREKMLVLLQKHGSVTNFEAETITNTDRHIHVLFSVKQIDENIIGMVMDISERKKSEKQLRDAYENINHLKKQLQAESAYLQEEIKLEQKFENIIGQSEELKYVLHRVEQVAPLESIVLIQGETGTGKELIARALHQLSSRHKRTLVKVNCAALPSELIENELFGREKGAYTGAATTQLGRFELANGSTLFLDEIGELPLALQAKLLRVIESGEFERLGNARTIKSDARIITATNRDLVEEVHNNHFREDLLYRLKIFPITIPPLRDRIDDIPLLVNNFVRLFARIMGRSRTLKISKKSMQKLQSYSWPGNVRELRHVVESSMITAQGNALHFDLPKANDIITKGDFKSLEEMERQHILEVLQEKNWKIAGEKSASSILDIHPNTLRSRMQKLGIKKP